MRKIIFLLLLSELFCLYSADLYRIKYNDKYGYIDKKKNIVIEPQYDYAEDFLGEFTIVGQISNKSDVYSVINKINIVFDSILKDCDRLSRVSETIFYNGFRGFFYDVSLKKMIELDKTAAPYFNLTQKCYYPSSKKEVEYIDSNFQTILTGNNWHIAYAMIDGMAFVIKRDWSQVVINIKGEEILDNVYDCGMSASEGLLAVETNKESGYINNKGEFVFHCSFEPNNHTFYPPGINYPFSEGVAAVQVRDGVFTIFAKKGKIILKEKSVLDMQPCKDGFILYQTFDNKYGFVRKNGQNAFTTEFDYAESFYNGFAIISYNGNDAILDKAGNVFLAKDLVKGKKDIFINLANK